VSLEGKRGEGFKKERSKWKKNRKHWKENALGGLFFYKI